jgi:TRAP-type C4-dicarboxylate transport system permease small subunit
MLAMIKKGLNLFLETLLTIVMTVLVLDVVWQVLSRYVLTDPSSWTEELATYLMIWVGMLGASVALNRGSHLGIDYMVSKFSVRNRLFGMFIGGILLVSRTLELGQTSPAMKVPMGYVYLAVPISGFFLVIYSVQLLLERIATLRKGPDAAQAAQVRATLD